MKTLIRGIVWLALIVWLGGLFFFPITAWASFSTIADTHAAGTIVAKCLAVLHHEGLFAGCVIVIFLAIGRVTRVYRAGAVIGIVATLVMLGFTAYSQFSIIPRMEKDRIAVGGAIDNVPPSDPHHADFDRLHRTSEHVEEAVMLAGVVLVIVLARES
jgi:hypothetical protein